MTLNIDKIRDIYENRKSKPLEINRFYSVLLPLMKIDGQLHILFEVRSMNIKQPGEISFPGGTVEVEEDFMEAAIRETHEEIGVDADKIEIIGELDYITNTSNFILYPFVGLLNTDYDSLSINRAEVEEIFTVPLDFFLENEPETYNVSYRPDFKPGFPFERIPNGRNYKWRKMSYPVLFYQYGDYVIWGMTAKMTYNFIKRLGKSK
jgi:8-oxo-dGTP pyrophosphatase MutT (NUDIX family)